MTTATIADTISVSVQKFVDDHLNSFDYNSHIAGLLYGQVQSGKTSQMLGVIAAAADMDFKIFLVLTADNNWLQRQTLTRAIRTLDTLTVCDETDDLRFRETALRRPTLIILKKNQNVLRSWFQHLTNSGFLNQQPIFILDDEADAASLNTRINKNEQSTINSLIEQIRRSGPSSIYIQVTATPQSLFLQRADSDWRPSFCHYFEPGHGYLGGDFFYGENSFCLRQVDNNEREILLSQQLLPQGLRIAILSFLIVSAHLRMRKHSRVCNFLIHPSVRIEHHEITAEKVRTYLDGIKNDLQNNSFSLTAELLDAWRDLSQTCNEILDFEEILKHIDAQFISSIRVTVLNSQTPPEEAQYTQGFNILIGGNSLGRGLTIPSLQVVYYCRTAKTPQADTAWQHSRIFGYDRVPELCRVFLPAGLLVLFRELNAADEAIFGVLREKGIDAITLMYPLGTKPTRTNVIDLNSLQIFTGGVNYFPTYAISANLQQLDDMLLPKANQEVDADLTRIKQILQLTEVEEDKEDWNKEALLGALDVLSQNEPSPNCLLVIRTERAIKHDTGTLLSPNDRELTQRYPNHVVLVMYRLTGERELGWQGVPLWVPNIKLPTGQMYYTIS